MKYRIRPGKKHTEDKVLEILTDGWEAPSYKQLLFILDHLFKNEDVLYPPPQFKGRKMLMEEIEKVYDAGH